MQNTQDCCRYEKNGNEKSSSRKQSRNKMLKGRNVTIAIRIPSIGKVEINLRETCKKTKFTPPSPIKATPTIAESDSDDKKAKEIHVSNSTSEKNNPPEGKATAIVAVMRGKPKEGYHRHSSNKHFKKKLVWVLLDSRSDGDLVFIDKDNTMLLPYSKKGWFHRHGILRMGSSTQSIKLGLS